MFRTVALGGRVDSLALRVRKGPEEYVEENTAKEEYEVWPGHQPSRAGRE